MSSFSNWLSHQGQIGRDLNSIGEVVAPVVKETVAGDIVTIFNNDLAAKGLSATDSELDDILMGGLVKAGLVPASAVPAPAAPVPAMQSLGG